MSNLLSVRARRGFAAGLATAVAAAGLSLAASAPAQALTPAGSLNWKVNQQFIDHLSTATFEDGAAADGEGSLTWPEKSVVVKPSGDTVISYGGSVRRSFAMSGTEYYHVKVAEPTLTVEADGDATVSAVVSSAAAAQGPTPAEEVAPVRVDVLSVPATGSVSTSYTAEASLDFLPTLFDGLAAGVEPHFKQTSTTVPVTEQPKKRPAGFTATATVANTRITTVTRTRTADGFSFAVKGSGYESSDPAFAGVYVGIAASGTFPDVSNPANPAIIASGYVPAAAIVDGALNTSLNVAGDTIVAGTAYSVYTWQAHSHSSTVLDQEKSVGTLKAANPVRVTATSVDTTAGVDITVTGANFISTNSANSGAYVGLAPTGGMPDVSSMTGMSSFVTAAYVPSAQLASGEFTRTLSVPREDLAINQEYSVYTWMAHTNAEPIFEAEATIGVQRGAKVAVTTKVAGTKATLSITGTRFNDGNDDYQGVYVGVAPVGGLPDVSEYDPSKFLASDWVMSGSITNGAFSRNLVVDLTKLKAGTSYALYTWQAHRHSTTDLDTATALSIKYVAAPIVKKSPAITLKWKKKSTAAKAGTVSFAVKKTAAKAATGKATFKITYTKKVVVKVKKGKKTIKKKVTKTFVKTVKNRTVKNGAIASVNVPKNTKKVVVSYTGDTYYTKGSKTLKR